MKLFYQLTPEQQDGAVHFCLFEYVIDDLLTSENVELASDDVSDEEEMRVKEKLRGIVDECHKLGEENWDGKVDLLMEDDEINHILHQIAAHMATTIHYHEPGEMVIYIDDLAPQKEDEDDGGTAVAASGDKKLLN